MEPEFQCFMFGYVLDSSNRSLMDDVSARQLFPSQNWSTAESVQRGREFFPTESAIADTRRKSTEHTHAGPVTYEEFQ